MLLELGRALSFIACILSLYWIMLGAWFVPGSRWQERVAACALRAVVAGCIAYASGMLFAARSADRTGKSTSPASTLPVRFYIWGLAAMTMLFFLSWYIEEYYLPLALKR
jgi:hypothetical protein